MSQCTTVIEKEKIIEKNVIQYYKKSLINENNYPQNIRLWVKIEDGIVVDNAILSDVVGTLYFDYTKNYSYGTKLYVRSSYKDQIWIFDIPHKNGEFVIIGYLKEE